MNIFLDIETIPQQPEEAAKIEISQNIKAPATMKKQETIDAWHNGEGKYQGEKDKAIEAVYRKTSFDGSKGEICSIAWAFGNNERIYSASMNLDQEEIEKEIIQAFFDSIKNESNPYFIGHYVAGFDLKFLFHRAVVLGIKPPCKLPFDGRHNSDYFCTMQAWAGFRDSISQENLCAALGIQGKEGMDGSQVWDYIKQGKISEVEEYNRNDVAIVREIYNRITFEGA